MDPEQIYQEVLSEEQAKGSPSAVAEARAKAARQRAVHGSPHPKEPRWWPGSQPQFEEGGGDAPAAVAEPEAEPEPEAAAEPAPEPAATPPDIGDQAQSERPDAPATSPAAPAEPAPQPVAAPAAAAVATAPAAAATTQLPPGVTHGTEGGNRLRPEDSVGTDAQFDAQKALAERRRLIDELVATGVPAATAHGSGRPKAPLLLLAYILIPLLAIALLAASDDENASAEAPPAAEEGAEGGEGGPTTAVTAAGNAFDVETITLVAGETASIEFDNEDSGAQHNIAIYDGADAEGDVLFDGELIDGPGSTTYEIEAPPKGEYYFQCDIHPDMNGNVVSE